MTHPNSCGLHAIHMKVSNKFLVAKKVKCSRMSWTIMESTDIWVEEITLNSVRVALVNESIKVGTTYNAFWARFSFKRSHFGWCCEIRHLFRGRGRRDYKGWCRAQFMECGHNFHLWSYFARPNNLMSYKVATVWLFQAVKRVLLVVRHTLITQNICSNYRCTPMWKGQNQSHPQVECPAMNGLWLL
jgi:hypothetical protein